MTTGQAEFEAICAHFASQYEVTRGKMMSSPGLRYRGKVFAFFHHDKMVFKPGEGFDIEAFGIADYGLLCPFKKKAPMRAWFEIPPSELQHWQPLAERALEFMRR